MHRLRLRNTRFEYRYIQIGLILDSLRIATYVVPVGYTKIKVTKLHLPDINYSNRYARHCRQTGDIVGKETD